MEHAMHCTAKKEKGRPFSRQDFSFFPQKVKTSTERLPPRCTTSYFAHLTTESKMRERFQGKGDPENVSNSYGRHPLLHPTLSRHSLGPFPHTPSRSDNAPGLSLRHSSDRVSHRSRLLRHVQPRLPGRSPEVSAVDVGASSGPHGPGLRCRRVAIWRV